VNTKLFCFVPVFCLLQAGTWAQEALSSAAYSANGTSVQLNWTLGECVVETFENGKLVLTQGYQQSRLTVTSYHQPVSSVMLRVYPNPVSESLIVEWIEPTPQQRALLSLYDSNGRMLFSREMSGNPESLNMQLFSPGHYLLKVSFSNHCPDQIFPIMKAAE